MKVICIDDDFTKCTSEVVKNILIVGDDGCLPKKGGIYEVIGYAYWDKYEGLSNVHAYLLDGLDSTHSYGSMLAFISTRFEVYDDTFIPNHITDKGELVRTLEIYCHINIQMNP